MNIESPELSLDDNAFECFQVQETQAQDEVSIEEVLIGCVQARPALWDSRLPLKSRSKNVRDQMWMEIYKEFGEQPRYSVEILVKKWRNLRDTYVRLKNDADQPSGSQAKKKRKWEYYELMSFLNDTISYRPTASNLQPSTDEPNLSNNEDNKTPSRRRKVSDGMETAVVDAINRMTNAPPPNCQKSINPICQKLSDILEALPMREKTELEIKLLQLAYNDSYNYL